MTRALSCLILAMVLAVVLAPAAEAANCEKTSLLDIQDEVMCVICGVPLVNAGGPQAEDQRNFIRERVEKCESKDQIKAALVDEYGPRVLAVPAKSGFDLAAYLVPVIVLLLALIGIVFGAISWKRSRALEGETAVLDEGDDARALDEDMRRYDL